MKPTKNKLFCVACQRTKMLFETQAEADRFVSFNKEEIEEENGRAPIRSYYCKLCGGYHVTSNPSEEAGEIFNNKTEHLAEMADEMSKANGDVKTVVNEITDLLNRIERRIYEGRWDTAELWIGECRKKIVAIRFCKGSENVKWLPKEHYLEKLSNMICKIRELGDEESEDWKAFIVKEGKTEEEEEITQVLINKMTLNELDRLFIMSDTDIENGDPEAEVILKECRQLLERIKGPFAKRIRDMVLLRIKGREEKIEKMCHDAVLSTDNNKCRPKIIINNEVDYKLAVFYLIERFEELQKEYDLGRECECKDILDVIAAGLCELPDNDDTALLKKKYEKWDAILNHEGHVYEESL